MNAFQSARETASAMLRDEVVKNASGVRCQALLRARRAMLIADVACGDWGPSDDGYMPGFVDAGYIADGIDYPISMPILPDAEWADAVVERSRVALDFLRVRVEKWSLIVEESVDGGYGDDGLGRRLHYELLLYGYGDKGND